jgi:hypothetical protein
MIRSLRMTKQMKVGDLVKCNDWVCDGEIGIIIEVRKCNGARLGSAYVHLLNAGIKFIRFDNLELVK